TVAIFLLGDSSLSPRLVLIMSPSSSDNTSPKLREAEVKLIDYKICNSDQVYEGYLTPRMMCAGYLQGGKDACQVSRGHTVPPALPTCPARRCPLAGYPQRGISCLLFSLLCPSVPG
uniref:Peptidase S1 domain-containing protein n=1 Tax=Bubo bubo TaxID=30461 RepID=A0A8C0F6R9_BUBBB